VERRRANVGQRRQAFNRQRLGELAAQYGHGAPYAVNVISRGAGLPHHGDPPTTTSAVLSAAQLWQAPSPLLPEHAAKSTAKPRQTRRKMACDM